MKNSGDTTRSLKMIHKRPKVMTDELYLAAPEDQRTIAVWVSPAQLRLLKRAIVAYTYKASEAARAAALIAILKDL